MPESMKFFRITISHHISLNLEHVNLVVPKEFDISRNNAHIRHGGKVARKCGCIIPNIDLIDNFAPFCEIFCNYCILGALGIRERTADIPSQSTIINRDIFMSFDIYWSFPGITVSECLYNCIRVIFFNIFCNIVCKIKHSTGRATEFFIHGKTVCTQTIIIVIVLRYRDKSWIFMFFKFCFDIGKKDFPHFLIGKAELSDHLTADPFQVYVEIREGKFHQVKRMCAKCGKNVLYLKRCAIGGLQLDETLSSGECRELTEAEKKLILQGTLPELA